jgi:methyl-accepting chemotaxis protein
MHALSLRITGRLVLGFAALAAILAGAVGFTSLMLGGVSQNVDRMVNLRTPVAIQSTQLVGNLYSTLATLRGYLLTGNPQGKLDRAGMWKEMDATSADFDKMVDRFTNPENKRKWAETKAILGEFRAAQDKAEAVAFTPDAYPATKLLVSEGAPRVQLMFSEITKMINEEEALEATPERKRLLKAMADARGNLASAAAQLRMYLLSGERSDQESFAAPWGNFQRAFAVLEPQRHLMTSTQRASFDAVGKARGEFAPLPERMFALRGSPQWNQPVHVLTTEAAPRALKILDLLDGTKQPDGTRSGGIKTNQQEMLSIESREVLDGIGFLKMVEWSLLAFGLGAAAVIVFLSARSIAAPIRKITSVLVELTNDRIVDVPYTKRTDEIGDIAKATEVFKQSVAQKVINYRVRAALDSVDSNVMIADSNYEIIYLNTSLQKSFREAEAEIRKALPQFDASKLIGASMDVFHKDSAHQRKLLDALTATHESHISIGTLKFQLLASPVFDEHRKRVGTCLEWKDETAQKAIEGEINDLIQAALAGDLSKRVPAAGKQGFMLNLTNAVNALCENVSKVMTDLVGMFGKLSEGDFRRRINADYHGTYGQLKNDANAMADRISSTVADIKAATREVTNASAEISTSTTDLSQRTEEQAASLEQTSASMEEIAATVKKNAENAQQANQSAANAREVANRGGQVVAKAVEAMGQIEGSSRKISDIIGVIDEIARQTNLLALNAAVEAARAGEAGRGFAVVASEVRNLAQRSSQAAKDITDLITNSNSQVQDGVELVNRAGTALAEIVESINQVATIVADIANASGEQATGIEQVNKALTQMDEVTQQNSALVEENAATAKTLDEQAHAMSERIAFFRVEEEGQEIGAAVRASARAPAPPAVTRPPSAPPRQRVAANGGPVARSQGSLAVAVNAERDWKEF